jgi:hypothetical protein
MAAAARHLNYKPEDRSPAFARYTRLRERAGRCGELLVIELREGDAFSGPVKLLVFVKFGHDRNRWRTILRHRTIVLSETRIKLGR